MSFIKFHLKDVKVSDLSKYEVSGLYHVDSKIAKNVLKKFSKFKQFIFLYRVYKNLPHDILLAWLATGFYFNKRTTLNLFYRNMKI